MNPADEVEELRAQQAATSEILRIISRLPADVQPVLDAVVENAVQLCAAEDCEIRLVDGDVHRPAAHFGSFKETKEALERLAEVPFSYPLLEGASPLRGAIATALRRPSRPSGGVSLSRRTD